MEKREYQLSTLEISLSQRTRNVTAFNERRYFLACVILRPTDVGVVKAVRLYICC
jgi:hypothetical protein